MSVATELTIPFGDPLNNGIIVAEEEATYDARFEFNAPRFHDFKNTSPGGVPLDEWFHTSATQGLATPPGAYCYNVPQETLKSDIKKNPRASIEVTLKPQQQPQVDPASQQVRDAEAEQVRAALAHITGNPNLKLSQAGAAKKSGKTPKRDNQPKSEPRHTRSKAVVDTEMAEQAANPSKPKQAGSAKKKPAAAAKIDTQGNNKAAVVPNRHHQATKAVVTSVRATSPKKRLSRSNTTTTAQAIAGRRAPSAAAPPRPKLQGVQKPARPAAGTKKAASGRNHRVTVPKSPLLLSKHRSAMHQSKNMKTTEDMEIEKVEKEKREAQKLRKLNAKTVRSVLTRPPKPVKHSTKPLTEPVPVKLRTSTRNRDHGVKTRSMTKKPNPALKSRTTRAVAKPTTRAAFGSRAAKSTTTTTANNNKKRQPAGTRPKLTLPRTPNFATKSRLRGSRYKPKEEEELEKIRNAPKFKARGVSKSVMEGRHVMQTRRAPVKATTVPQPFRFATDARAAKRPAPQADEPRPFVFGGDSGNGGRMTRNRARMATTTAAHRPVKRPASATSSEPEQDEQPVLQASDPSQKRRRITAAGLRGGAVRVVVQKTQEDDEEMQDGGASTEDKEQENDGMQAVFRGRRGSGRAMLHNPLYLPQ